MIKEPRKKPMPPGKGGRWVFNLFICLVVIGAGIAGAAYISKSSPKARKRPPAKMAPLVRVATVNPVDHQVTVQAMGTVIPAQEMILKTRVAGEILSVHPEFAEGGFFKKSEQVLVIDPADYKVAYARKKSAVTNAEYAWRLELGHQAVAKREWELLGGGKSSDGLDLELALRKPHLAKVKAELTAAKAELKRAALDLERTKIHAPFNAIVREKNVEVGSQVSAQGALATLVGTDVYHIRVSVPSDRLSWIDIPRRSQDTGADVVIGYRNGFERKGTVFKLLSDLESQGRMARVLVSVQNPLGLAQPDAGQPPLLIGEYVRVDIQGRQVDNVYRIPRSALRDNRHVWVVGDDGTLEIRNVDTVWRDARTVLIKEGLQPGDRLIVSDLPTPIAGMPLKLESAESAEPPAMPAQRKAKKG